MSVVWATNSFNYYMVQYTLSHFKDEYEVSLMSAISDIVGMALGGILFHKIGAKLLFVISNGLACVGGIVILVYGLDHEYGWVLPIVIFATKFGLASSFSAVWVSHNAIFPLLFSATALGIVNFLARLAGAMSPLFDVLEEPYPMLSLAISSGLASLSSLFL